MIHKYAPGGVVDEVACRSDQTVKSEYDLLDRETCTCYGGFAKVEVSTKVRNFLKRSKNVGEAKKFKMIKVKSRRYKPRRENSARELPHSSFSK